MKIVLTGATGLVGREVAEYFESRGHEILRMVRRKPVDGTEIYWDPLLRQIESEKLEGCDVVIHLAGANIASRRWSLAYKDQILSSRVDGTKFLATALSILKKPPKVFICASAVGFYGNYSSDKTLNESSPAGRDFLANVCVEWEKAAEPAISAAVRTVFLRLGMVVSKKGGALGKMLPVFRLGGGGKIGSGEQMMSWIALPEIPEIMNFVIQNKTFSGPVNAVSPHPVCNAEFTTILGKALRRPTILPLPAFVVKLLFGEMGETLLLGGARVMPDKLLKSGYVFKFPDLSSTFVKEFLK